VTDRIVVKGLRAVGICGVLEEERTRAQPFELTIVLERDLSAPGRSDDLSDTIDYGDAATRAVAAVERSSYQLLEALATEIATELLEVFDSVDAVEVHLDKLEPPLPFPMYATGVVRRLTRNS